jgi:hypothetical protein
MTEPDPQALDALFNELLHTEDDVLAVTRQSAVDAGMPVIEVWASKLRVEVNSSVSPRWPSAASVVTRIDGGRLSG